jgi:hypothetical protein
VRRLLIEPSILGTAGTTLDFDPDLDVIERIHEKNVTACGPCPSGNDNRSDEPLLNDHYAEAHSSELVFLASGRAVRVQDWSAGSGDVFARRTYTLTPRPPARVELAPTLVGQALPERALTHARFQSNP